MIKKIILKSCQKKINILKPAVNVCLHKEMPTPSLRETTQLARLASQVNGYEAELINKPDSFFKEKAQNLRQEIKEKIVSLEGKERLNRLNEILEQQLPFFYALVRESAKRTVQMRHFDVQIIGGIVLNNNKIAEMVTGEGKTLVATLPAALNALSGYGVHVVTVNDYLARRDKEWMEPIYNFLGFSVGVIQQDMNKEERRQAYACDITYGTNNEFGFDYLRDNMVVSAQEMVQRQHFYAIVDEVDSILVDEARTPLIISGPSEVSIDKYYLADKVIRQLKVRFIIQSVDGKDGLVLVKHRDGSELKISAQEFEADYDAIVEEKSNNAYFTDKGEQRCAKLLNVESISDFAPDKFSNPWLHYLTQALRAHNFFHADKEYIVSDGKVLIVDEFTGRLMPGRRWSDGLHQAVEAKERLKIQEESQTLATITLQNYFRMYDKLAGMTGTAYTEAGEFKHIYNLDVVAIPTNRELIRVNYPDRIFKNKKGKFAAVVNEIVELYQKKQPVLVGTISIEDSEEISFLLAKRGIKHNVLNAKYHEREAHIVAQAGRLGQVTIATNMAGRGTDIVLGGNLSAFIKDLLAKNEITSSDSGYRQEYEKLYSAHKPQFDQEHKSVIELGGLHIIGTQRHEARRIDNQLRGRSGRQGDPGSSRFYVSLEDDLMRLFGSERIYFLMDRLGFPEDETIEHPIVSRSLEIAQKRVEGHNFEIRKQLLEYDNIMNKQREVVYQQRKLILNSANIETEFLDMLSDVVDDNLAHFSGEEKDFAALARWAHLRFSLELTLEQLQDNHDQTIKDWFKSLVDQVYQERKKSFGQEEFFQMQRQVALWVIDSRWKEHLLVMDSLKEGIYLRGYAQSEPLVEYQKESFTAFQEMIAAVKEGIVDWVFKMKLAVAKETVGVFEQAPKSFVHSEFTSLQESPKTQEAPNKPLDSKTNTAPKVGRNEPCPCGSGKKYKKCCGK